MTLSMFFHCKHSVLLLSTFQQINAPVQTYSGTEYHMTSYGDDGRLIKVPTTSFNKIGPEFGHYRKQ